MWPSEFFVMKQHPIVRVDFIVPSTFQLITFIMAGFHFDQWYLSVPPITRLFMTGCAVTTVCEYLGIVTALDLYLNYALVFQRMEVWRLVTTFLFMGDLGLPFILKMYFAIRYSRMLEEGHYRGRTADFAMMWIFGALSLLGLNASFHFYKWKSWKPPPFLGPALVNVILYVWAKRSPYIRMNFMGLFNFPATFLPWVILGLEFVLGSNAIIFDVLGILIGHIFHFLTEVYPITSGRHLLPTPTILKLWLDNVIPPNPADQQQQNGNTNNNRHNDNHNHANQNDNNGQEQNNMNPQLDRNNNQEQGVNF